MTAPNTDVVLAITPSCPHCPSMMAVLTQLAKKGDIADLRIINIASNEAFASQHGIRSVPWLKIGPFILQGLHSQKEIEQWLEQAASPEGLKTYFTQQLNEGELETVSRAIQASPETARQLIPLISDNKTSINARLGMAAIFEELAGQPLLEILLDDLIGLLHHAVPRVRGDAAHFLSFIKSDRALAALQQVKEDEDDEVREIVQESIEAQADFN